MWALILTLTTIRGTALAVVPGFKTEAACFAAADAWRNQQLKSGDYTVTAARSLCAKVD